MNRSTPWLMIALFATTAASAADAAAARKASTVVLDATGVQNLRIQTAVAEPGDFEETIFALGRVESKPGNVAAVSSKISGRVVALAAVPGEEIAANTEVVKVESRQPGNPPPTIGVQAPIGGMVTQVAIRLGDPVEPDRALLEISDLREVLAIARVPEHSAGRIKPGAEAHITVSALGGRAFKGTLLRFGTAADVTSGTIDALFLLQNEDRAIRPGMRVEFSIVVGKRSGVVSVPRSALQGDPAGRFVYVKDFDLPNAFIKTPVVVGQINEQRVEIVSGLLPADEVVTQGAYSLAFSGGGTTSLKEALDAAHGHAHNADGSEITPEQKKAGATAGKTGAKDDHGHDHSHEHENEHHHSPFWQIVSGVLFVLLLVIGFRRSSRRDDDDAPASPGPAK